VLLWRLVASCALEFASIITKVEALRTFVKPLNGLPIGVENITPILRVEDLEANRRYYIETLGFSLEWNAGGMISVSRDQKSIMLCEGDQGRTGTWLWVGVDDADAFFAELSAKGAHIRSPPRNFSWAYEFEVEDLDDHVLRFGSEPKLDPVNGDLKP
jgi:predicted lactoylglutathione lyase